MKNEDPDSFPSSNFSCNAEGIVSIKDLPQSVYPENWNNSQKNEYVVARIVSSVYKFPFFFGMFLKALSEYKNNRIPYSRITPCGTAACCRVFNIILKGKIFRSAQELVGQT